VACGKLFSLKHIPSFLDNAEAIKAKGVDEILVVTGLMSLLACLDFFFRRDPRHEQGFLA
jgi:hypothetical protein